MAEDILVAVYKKTFETTQEKNRTLEVYETKTLYKFKLWDSSKPLFKVATRPLVNGKVKKKDVSLNEILAKYGFTPDN